MTDEFPFPDPRLQGINEHHHRARWFLLITLQANEHEVRFRFLITAVYFARGIVELMLDAARAQVLKGCVGTKTSRKAASNTKNNLPPHCHIITSSRKSAFTIFIALDVLILIRNTNSSSSAAR